MEESEHKEQGEVLSPYTKRGELEPSLSQRFIDKLESAQFFGIVLFVFAVAFPPFDVLTDISLPIHMLQHVLIAIGGVMIGYPFFKSGKLDRFKNAKTGLLGVVVLAGLLVFWHLPPYWDAAVLSWTVHIVEHFCFFVIGLFIGMFVPMLPDNIKIILAVLAVSAHMFYGFALYIINTPVYPLYPVAQQSQLGLALFSPSPVYLIGYLYFNLTRESKRIDREVAGPNKSPDLTSRNVPRERISLGRLLILVLGVLMIVSLIGYYSVTTIAISSASAPKNPHISYVYIDEGPFVWQYSPQDITVELGMNNTVTWVSHSLSTDTITSLDNIFSSGPIGPGQTFSYTFTTPGVYTYYCVYHLWMKGTITVISA